MKPTKIQDLFDNPEADEHDDEDAKYLKEGITIDEDEDEDSENYDE